MHELQSFLQSKFPSSPPMVLILMGHTVSHRVTPCPLMDDMLTSTPSVNHAVGSPIAPTKIVEFDTNITL